MKLKKDNPLLSHVDTKYKVKLSSTFELDDSKYAAFFDR